MKWENQTNKKTWSRLNNKSTDKTKGTINDKTIDDLKACNEKYERSSQWMKTGKKSAELSVIYAIISSSLKHE